MKYTVDEIIDNNVVLIDLTGNKKNVSISVLPCDIKENDVVIFNNNRYVKDEIEKEKRIETIKSKMDMLRNNE